MNNILEEREHEVKPFDLNNMNLSNFNIPENLQLHYDNRIDY